MGLYCIQSSGETDFTCWKNREPVLWSRPYGPPCSDTDGSRGEEGEGKPNACTLHCHPHYDIKSLDCEAPYIHTTVVETSVIRVGMEKDPTGGSWRTTRVSNLLRLERWMGSVWGWGILTSGSISSSSACPWVWEYKDNSLVGTWRIFCLSLTPQIPLKQVPFYSVDHLWFVGGICNQEHSSILVHHQETGWPFL